jgi:hypothetical protein
MQVCVWYPNPVLVELVFCEVYDLAGGRELVPRGKHLHARVFIGIQRRSFQRMAYQSSLASVHVHGMVPDDLPLPEEHADVGAAEPLRVRRDRLLCQIGKAVLSPR